MAKTDPALPPFTPWEVVADRLPRIFQEGTPNRNYCTNNAGVAVVFAMLYIGAVEGSERWMAPAHAYRMTDQQIQKTSDEDRLAYGRKVIGLNPPGNRVYRDNSREGLRDETLRQGFREVGAVIQRPGVPSTSSKGRYALEQDFAALFDPRLEGAELEAAIRRWQETHLDPHALNRLRLARELEPSEDSVFVNLPNGQVREMSPGPSSSITKNVVEDFAPRFLWSPQVLWISESGNRVVARDHAIASRIGLDINAASVLPDVILVDLPPNDIRVIFVEVVHSDGAITEQRRRELLELTDQGGYDQNRVTLVTAYGDRKSVV